MFTIFWFRRDLRLQDNTGLYHALKDSVNPVLPLFIFDTNILSGLEDKTDARVEFIYNSICTLKTQLDRLGSSLLVETGDPVAIWKTLIEDLPIKAVYTNRDYESYARNRDAEITNILKEKGISFHDFKDHVILEYNEVLKSDGKPYTVFTPYSRTWKNIVKGNYEDITASPYLASSPSENYLNKLVKISPVEIPSLEDLGFKPSNISIPPLEVKQSVIRNYANSRDYPYLKEGTSKLGIHFRFGTISIREKARKAAELSETYLNELIWRDFYSQILANFPYVATNSFRPEYDKIEWRNNKEEFEKWCAGKTGYPIVDAGMRELLATGYMHNRVRMVVSSFLTKHLLIDWRWGESWFAKKLLDFDLASNSGGWQWAAGCGTDAAPYFRIFNPYEQQKKFDPEFQYIRKWVPEYGTMKYPKPIVDHSFARTRCLEVYKKALSEK